MSQSRMAASELHRLLTRSKDNAAWAPETAENLHLRGSSCPSTNLRWLIKIKPRLLFVCFGYFCSYIRTLHGAEQADAKSFYRFKVYTRNEVDFLFPLLRFFVFFPASE